MVNLEWYRTFKSVYKTVIFLLAKELFISQPAVSQQISMEAHVGYKLSIESLKALNQQNMLSYSII
jgi:DNA-binding transcriptional LysR family regulator